MEINNQDLKESNLKDEYVRELSHAMSQLKNLLSQGQMIMGVIETFLHLINKESQKQNNNSVVSNNGK